MTELRDRLQQALRTALKERYRSAAAAVRSALAAIANAEAVDVATATEPLGANHATIAGTVAGVGAAEAARRDLTGDDLDAIVAGEISDRRTAAEQYHRSGRTDRAEQLRHEAELLDRILGDR